MDKKSIQKSGQSQLHIEEEVKNCIANSLKNLTENDKKQIIEYLRSVSTQKCI